jgi:hypothetical protein
MDCPSCGNRSKQVDTVTVKSLVRRLPFGMPQTQYYFCDAPGCEVILEGGPHVALAEEPEIGDAMVRYLEGEMVRTCANVRIKNVERADGEFRVYAEINKRRRESVPER